MRKPMALVLACCLCLGGCTAATEVRDRAFVQMLGVTGKETQLVTITPFDAEAPVTGRGETLFAAIDDAEAQQDKVLFFGHAELFAVGEGDLRGRLTMLLDGNHISPACQVLYAEDVTEALGDPETAPTGILDSMGRKGLLVPRTAGEVLTDLLGRSGRTVLPYAKGDDFFMAVVDTDGKPLGVLDAAGARGLCWLIGRPENVYCGLADVGGDVLVREAASSLQVTVEEGRVHAAFSIRLRVHYDTVTDPAQADRLLQALVAAECKAAVEQTAYACSADVLQLERGIQRADPEFYEAHASDWATVLQEMQVSCTVRVREI